MSEQYKKTLHDCLRSASQLINKPASTPCSPKRRRKAIQLIPSCWYRRRVPLILRATGDGRGTR